MQGDRWWRLLFGGGGLVMAIGGPLHPRDETMHAMLINPDWFPSHMAQLVGFAMMTLGMMRYRRLLPHSAAVHRWSGLAALALALQTVEMAFHLASMVDADKLAAGAATPILSTHIVLAVTIYPLLAILMSGFVVAAAKTRELGNPWLAPLAIFGLVAQAVAVALVVGLDMQAARIGFPMVMAFAVWTVVVSLMPVRSPEAT
jgi:hypothetical protein